MPHASLTDAAATSEDQRRGLQGHGAVDVAWPRHLRAAGRLRATVPRCVEITSGVAGQHDATSPRLAEAPGSATHARVHPDTGADRYRGGGILLRLSKCQIF